MKMKQHLVNLLLIEYLQEKFLRKIEDVGIKMDGFGNYNILNIVIDIVGFPRDNTLVYDFHYLNTGERGNDPSLKLPDEELFLQRLVN